MTRQLQISVLVLGLIMLPAAFAAAQESILEAYIREGLERNDAIRRQNFLLEKSLYALKEARGFFLPQASVGSTYTTATGGRRIEFPVGDLLNPVYNTLNRLTNSTQFPQIANVDEQFFPRNFYDVRMRAVMPLINAEITYNYLIKKEQVSLQQAEVNVYKRQLVADIKTAYYRYLQAGQAVAIYRNALELLAENRRVNESLVRNGVANATVLSRIDSEIARIKAQTEEAANNERNAIAYFNFLINRELEAEVLRDTTLVGRVAVLSAADVGIAAREELQKLQSAVTINQLALKLNRAYWMPKVGVALDLGSQGFDFAFNDQTRYLLFNLTIDIPIFSGFRNVNKIKQVDKDLAAMQAEQRYVEDQLKLQLQLLINNYKTAVAVYKANETQMIAAQRFYGDTFKRYKEGQANYLEVLDAQTQLVNAQIQLSIAQENILIRLAEIERAQATYPL
ncbi:TolC family protein [Rhodoflexus sp.]